jgi:hypothetical protein
MKADVGVAESKNQNRGVVAAICRNELGVYQGVSVLAVLGISDPAT